MGRMLTLTNSNDVGLGVKKRTLKRELVIGPTTIKFITLTLFGILALVYLTQSTAGANRSIKVQQIDDQKTQLELRKESLEVESTRLQSLQQIDQNIEKPSMEPISQVQHIEASSNTFAKL